MERGLRALEEIWLKSHTSERAAIESLQRGSQSRYLTKFPTFFLRLQKSVTVTIHRGCRVVTVIRPRSTSRNGTRELF